MTPTNEATIGTGQCGLLAKAVGQEVCKRLAPINAGILGCLQNAVADADGARPRGLLDLGSYDDISTGILDSLFKIIASQALTIIVGLIPYLPRMRGGLRSA